uniref:Uncharacterized protein n=1 Tax=Cacopsylla melanoneura TaxID=428564 RepID=A0A8D8LZD0_9HEMI
MPRPLRSCHRRSLTIDSEDGRSAPRHQVSSTDPQDPMHRTWYSHPATLFKEDKSSRTNPAPVRPAPRPPSSPVRPPTNFSTSPVSPSLLCHDRARTRHLLLRRRHRYHRMRSRADPTWERGREERTRSSFVRFVTGILRTWNSCVITCNGSTR